ncbi:UNVERIFIED_CONTAM: putative ribonuclease H protein [Sesamum latifolium]|uniref:Ribonuclease H protein n=1 Tax=Sesamum latifolium TaxID=2727402 RepID=A0AAW2UGB7_9LAMI
MLHGWNWFVDPNESGNRIWLAWDTSEVVVDILSVHEQYIHYRILSLRTRTDFLVTIAYGLNHVVSHRALWPQLVTTMEDVGEEPWLVLGHFNTVLDHSEVCGHSGDIQTAMGDFRTFLTDTGLIPMPSHEAVFSWHNCSDGPRSLWKKLDRILANDRWFARWPIHLIYVQHHVPRITLHLSYDGRMHESAFGLIIISPNHQSNAIGTEYAPTASENPMAERGDQCSKIFFRKVAARRAAQKIFHINSENGDNITEESGVADEFVRFYTTLLGGRRRDNHVNLMFLQRGARYIIPHDEGEIMIRPVEREEIKAAFFNIAEDKAPGPDGFSAGFFKAAWNVIGDELTTAVQDFFISGKMLKQELFHGYNRQNLPPRCALKVDLWKAYDTLEWDFINAMLYVFGFPEKLIMWIVECISTTTFSISLNGELHGFFPGARVFVRVILCHLICLFLAMEILHLMLLQRIEQDESFQLHWQCTEMKLFNLCFADDLILFCKAEEASVILFRDALHAFAELSGLHANISKSQLILSKSASPVRNRIGRYLDFKKDTYRIQLLKSVISALNIYWATAFILPSGVLKTIEARMRKFLWQGGNDSGAAKVAWVHVCKPLEEGGQGLRRLEPLNRALMSKHFWELIQCNKSSIWVMWITNMYLRHCSAWTARVSSGSWSWRKILKLRSQLLANIIYHIGVGDSVWLWHDPWHHLGPLMHRFSNGPHVTGIPLESKVNLVINEHGWNWPPITDIEHMEIVDHLPHIEASDGVRWNSTVGEFTITDAYHLFQPPGPTVCWHVLLRGPFRIPRNCFILWLAVLERLSTLDKTWWTGLVMTPLLRNVRHGFALSRFDYSS